MVIIGPYGSIVPGLDLMLSDPLTADHQDRTEFSCDDLIVVGRAGSV